MLPMRRVYEGPFERVSLMLTPSTAPWVGLGNRTFTCLVPTPGKGAPHSPAEAEASAR